MRADLVGQRLQHRVMALAGVGNADQAVLGRGEEQWPRLSSHRGDAGVEGGLGEDDGGFQEPGCDRVTEVGALHPDHRSFDRPHVV